MEEWPSGLQKNLLLRSCVLGIQPKSGVTAEKNPEKLKVVVFCAFCIFMFV